MNEEDKGWSISIGFYPGVVIGMRSYYNENMTSHVLYIPFFDIAGSVGSATFASTVESAGLLQDARVKIRGTIRYFIILVFCFCTQNTIITSEINFFRH